jgi:omega-hydroxy-beta-dihydromenaquinone-9 sulfotransferase
MLYIAASALLVAGFLFAPFPYFPTYRLLWRHVLFTNQPQLRVGARARQAIYLLAHGMSTPLWTLLWYTDEVLFSEYRRKRITPIFIIGEPRSGTTLLHRTLAEDAEHFFAVRHYEWRYPFICVQKILRLFRAEEMLRRADYWPRTEVGRIASRMHPDTLYDYEEDGIFFEERFLHHLFVFLRFPYPELLPTVDEFRELPEPVRRRMLATHGKVLQKVAYLRGGDRRYLSKEVTSHTKIPALLLRYPNARFIVVLRPSSDFMGSLLALVRSSTHAKTGVDPITIPGWREAFLLRMRTDCRHLVEVCNQVIASESQVRVSFRALTSDIISAIYYLYGELGLRPGTEYLDYVRSLQLRQDQRVRGYEYQRLGPSDLHGYDSFVEAVERQCDAALETSHLR